MLDPLTASAVVPLATSTVELLSRSYDSYQSKELRLAEIRADSEVKLATSRYELEATRRSAAAQIATSLIQSSADVRSIAIQTLGACARRLVEVGQYDHAGQICNKIEKLADAESPVFFAPLL